MCRNLMCQILYFWLSSSFFFLFFLNPPSPLLFAHPFLVSYFWKMEHQKREKLVNDQYTLLYLVYLYYVGTEKPRMTKSLKEIWPTNGLHSQGHRIQLSNVRFFFHKKMLKQKLNFIRFSPRSLLMKLIHFVLNADLLLLHYRMWLKSTQLVSVSK